MKKQFGILFNKLIRVIRINLFFMLILLPSVSAYEAVVLDFPVDEGWHKVYYSAKKSGAIVQYVPMGESKDYFNETVVYRSYKGDSPSQAKKLMNKRLQEVKAYAKDLDFKMLRTNQADSMMYWCASKFSNLQAPQCEIVRSAKSHEGVIMMHYVNKNINNFQQRKNLWIELIRKASTYYSYYRTDYVLNKEIYFEL